MQDKGGSVLNIVSVGGMTFGGLIGVYDITKAGLIHMTKHLATELAPQVRAMGDSVACCARWGRHLSLLSASLSRANASVPIGT